MRANWNYPTALRFGAGRLAELAEGCRALGMQRPLLVTDRGLGASAIVGDALGVLRDGGLDAGLFAEVQGNPVGSNVEAGLLQLHEGGYDGVVALGGGSALDAGKAIAMMAGQHRPLW
ncbi:MAG: iron-containing alcohol dehydrogenase, partial [Gammaproteobacteria bacterium]